jgi:ABC-type lipoprotein export system ATPase subunit
LDTTIFDILSLEMRDINLYYNLLSGRRVIFQNLSIKVFRGEKIGILGKSGSGKTSLINLIQNEIHPKKGTLILNETPKVLGQFPVLNPWLTCEEQIDLSSKTDIAISDLLKDVGMLKQKNQLISSLSLGQKQRIALLSVLVSNYKLILADEPFSRLDSVNAKNLLNLFHEKINSSDYTLIMTSHSPNYFLNFSRVYEINNYNLQEIDISDKK